MSELLFAEQKSFKSFIIFSFFSLVTLIIFLSLFSSKYTVNDIRYENNHDLNYESFGFVQGKSIWFINESDFRQFYDDNFNVESLTISKIISLILTVNKYDLSIQDLSITYNGSELTGSYKNTLLNIGSPIDLSKKGSVVGYILEEGNCDGEVTIIDSNSEDIETLLNC